MRLEDVTARIRPRGAWESVDLGFALVRRQFGQLLLAWCLTVGPLWALLLGASYWIPLGWILLIIWWLKPFYSRVPLFILSRSLFGARPTLRETLRAWPRLLFGNFFRLVLTRVPWLIVSPRFAWNRALLLAAIDLEGQHGKGLRQRQAILLQQAGGASPGLTLLLGGYQLALVPALLSLVSNFGWDPTRSQGITGLLWEAIAWDIDLSPSVVWTLIVGYLITLTVIELFYVGGGFGLYLNCRTSLEGWDVELSFRRLAQRVTKVAAVLMFFAVPAVAVSAVPAQRLEKSQRANLEEEQERVHQILKDDDFTVYKEKRYVSTSSRESTDLSAFGKFFYYSGWFLFYAAIAAFVGFVAWLIWTNRHIFSRRHAAAPESRPKTVMGMDITPESLPADILAAARARWLAGDARGALSLLYRGALLWLVQSARVPIRESDTEGDCLRHSLSVPAPEQREYFGDLTNQWIYTAYATHPPPAEAMERLLSTWPYEGGNRGARA